MFDPYRFYCCNPLPERLVFEYLLLRFSTTPVTPLSWGEFRSAALLVFLGSEYRFSAFVRCYGLYAVPQSGSGLGGDDDPVAFYSAFWWLGLIAVYLGGGLTCSGGCPLSRVSPDA